MYFLDRRRPRPVTDALRASVLEDLPELAYIRSDELRRKAIEAWAYALAETDFLRVAAIPGEATPGVFAHPTTLAYGSATGVILHLAGEMLKNMAGFEMLHVPYSGNGPALTDVLGGRLQVMVDAVSNSAPYIADGKLRPLVVPSRQRTPLQPDVPSSAEAGLLNYQGETWFALYGPGSHAGRRRRQDRRRTQCRAAGARRGRPVHQSRPRPASDEPGSSHCAAQYGIGQVRRCRPPMGLQVE
jgi:hypothetical protein